MKNPINILLALCCCLPVLAQERQSSDPIVKACEDGKVFTNPLNQDTETARAGESLGPNQFQGRFIKDRYVIVLPGTLARAGVKAEDILLKMNGWKVTRKNWEKPPAATSDEMQIVFFRPRNRKTYTATLKPESR